MMPTYTLSWQAAGNTHRVTGRGPAILYLYDTLAGHVNGDNLCIYAKYSHLITREALMREMGMG